MEQDNKKIDVSNQIDLVYVFKVLFNKKRLFCKTIGISIIIGLIVAFSIPKSYKTEVVLAPEMMSSSSVSSSLSDIASMVGINFKAGGTSYDAIYPEIYPQIISSTPFLTDLFDIKVSSGDGVIKDVPLYQYLTRMQKSSWWDAIKYSIIRFIKSFKKKSEGNGVHELDNFKLTEAEFETAKGLNSMIECSVDKKTSMITLSFVAQDAVISASVVDTIQRKLQEYVTEYRTKKAKIDLTYALKLYEEAKAQYMEAQQNFADFSDANENLILERYKVKRDDLENEMQLRFNVYNQITQQVQMARAKIQERTPAFTQIQPATVPIKKDSPKRMFILFGYMLFAFILTSVYVLVKDTKSKEKSPTE